MRHLKAAAILTIALMAVKPAQAQESFGFVAGMQTKVSRDGRNMRVGDKVFLNDTVRTNRTGISQFQFNDNSTAKLGPNSVIAFTDEVTRIAGRSPSIAVRMLNGLSRFSGSAATKGKPLKVQTPNMALGVLGGIVDVVVTRRGTEAALRNGRMVCVGSKGPKVVRNSGYSCVQDSQGRFQVRKTNPGFGGALDSTDTPNLNGLRDGGRGTRAGRNPSVNEQVACGSGSGANAPGCTTRGGGFPKPGGALDLDQQTTTGTPNTFEDPPGGGRGCPFFAPHAVICPFK